MRIFLLLAALCAPVLAQEDLDKLRASVVQVYIVGQSEDYYRPWQRPGPSSWTGSAFCIGEKQLLTNAHNVADSKILRVKRADMTKRFDARVLFAGHDCDLALITVDDAEFWKGIEPLAIGSRPEMRSTVSTVGYPTGGNKLSVTKGIVSRIELRNYSHSQGDAHLAIQTDAAINPGNSGGPVLQDGLVVGVAFQGRIFAQNIGYMIPPSVMNHFREDIRDGQYDGYPELGLETANLENDSLRAYLGVPEGATGVVVLKPTPYASCVGLIQRNDVLHKIDGIPIENDGKIQVGSDRFDHILVVEDKQVGETVTLTIRRAGTLLDVPIQLKSWRARMKPSLIYDERPQYAVYGGYVFVPLTTNYLWRTRGSEELTYYFQQYYRTVAEEGKTREQLVLLSRVLKHPSTRYRSYSNGIIEKVDGVTPNDFREFVKLVDESKGNLVKIEFEGVNIAPLILDKAKLAKIQQEIMQRYNISEERHLKEGR
ncbi:MAG: S1C family serine protease [Planctomycetota bacterium]|jgi:S1-C subfamily serine protease